MHQNMFLKKAKEKCDEESKFQNFRNIQNYFLFLLLKVPHLKNNPFMICELPPYTYPEE